MAPGPPRARAVATPARLPGAYPRSGCNAKCLKRRNRVLVVPACYSVAKQPEHFPDIPELYEFTLEGKVDPDTD